jgi:hypothetical protein
LADTDEGEEQMTWSVNLGPLGSTDLESAVDAVDIQQDGASTPEQAEQIALAKKLAKQGILSGALGGYDDGTLIGITLTGHANPLHNLNAEGASGGDILNISFRQTAAPEPPAPAPEPAEGLTDQDEPMPEPTVYDDGPA